MTISTVFKFIEEFFRITWLSVSSTQFYQDLYKKYHGYGIKYIAMAIAITSIVYSLFVFDTITTMKYYLTATNDDANPVEYLLKQWPDIKYNGKEISLDSDGPVLINTINGKVAMAIDPDNKLTVAQKQIIPVILQKTQIIVNFIRSNDSNAKPKEMSLGYNLFSSEAYLLNQSSLKMSLLNLLEPIGITTLLLVIPVLTLVRLLMHLASSLFSMVILFAVLWWLKLNPTTKSVSRVVLFSSGAAEIISPVLLIFIPGFLVLASFLEYWAIILAIYGLSNLKKNP